MEATAARPDIALMLQKLGDHVVKVKEFRGDTWLCLKTEGLLPTLELLKSDPELQYTYFAECVGVDYSTWRFARDLPGRFEVVYNLFSLRLNERIFLKVSVDDGGSLPTAKHIFSGAEYPEREIQDMFGVRFEGNEEASGMRFLLPDDWVGYPLRKEYPLGGEDVVFDRGFKGPAVEDIQMPHAGESFEGKTGSEDVSGR